MVSISISFDKNVRTFGNCIKRKWKDFTFFVAFPHQFTISPPFVVIMFINKKGVYRFLALLLVQNWKEIPVDFCWLKNTIGKKKRNHVRKGSDVKKFMIYSSSWTREYVTLLHMNCLISNTQTRSSTLSFYCKNHAWKISLSDFQWNSH